jgi:adenylate cyclase class IV
MNTDETEPIRRKRLVEINSTVESHDGEAERKRLEAQHGQVWDTEQLSQQFEVLGFMAPYVVVRRRSDGRKGSLEFQHLPRLYFNFVLD